MRGTFSIHKGQVTEGQIPLEILGINEGVILERTVINSLRIYGLNSAG
jgi:hypothetical protein